MMFALKTADIYRVSWFTCNRIIFPHYSGLLTGISSSLHQHSSIRIETHNVLLRSSSLS